MKEAIEDAKEELKRVDHLIFVSLKYTRTVDVLLNVIKRLIDAYDFAIEALLRFGKDKNMFSEEIPNNPISKTELVLRVFKDPVIKQNMELYLLFRKIVKININDYERLNEYRRHVTLKTKVDKENIEIKIDNVTEYYTIIKEFVKYIDNLIREVEE